MRFTTLSQNIKTIPHNYAHAANQTVFWDTSDSKENYEKNLLDPKKKSILQQLGYLGNKIEYKFNSHGFRTQEFTDQFDVVCFGDSLTMGTGIHSQHTWPEQLSLATGLSVVNLAHAGSSNDTAYRIAHHYLEFLRPRYAIWLQTDRARIELVDDYLNTVQNILPNDQSNHYSQDRFVRAWMLSETSQQINLDKNTRAFEHLCQQLNIISIVLPCQERIKIDLARDLQHPGQLSHMAMAKKIQAVMQF